jgi:hypothetical protein
MKRLIKFAVYFLSVVFVFGSCKKETNVQQLTPTNRPPVANAGSDQFMIYPADSTLLTGSGKDPDGAIVSYRWSKISGPSVNIAHANHAVTAIRNLMEGIYEFELEITDNGGLTAKDRVSVVVNKLPSPGSCSGLADSVFVRNGTVKMVPFGKLSQARYGLVSATAGDRIIFAGGYECRDETWKASTRVDIFDMNTQAWTIAALSSGGGRLTSAAVGNKILITDGASGYVDIYDASTSAWTSTRLSIARRGISATTIGDKVFFAGGTTGYDNPKSTRVDIYDGSTNTWSTAELGEGRLDIASAALGNNLFFAGGFTDENWWDYVGTSRRVDIYNIATLEWSTAFLSEARGAISAIPLNNKVFFAGGLNDRGRSNKVDIYDNSLNSWSTATLAEGRFRIQVARLGDNILFATGFDQIEANTRMDIYNATSDSWSIADLNLPLTGLTVVTAGNAVYVAGGEVGYKDKASDIVWKLEF